MDEMHNERTALITFYVYLVVAVSGAAVLAIELLGTRLLAPFFGSDIYLWSALISVTLAALSCGYAVGGRFADRNPRALRLAAIAGLAGLWILVVPWLRYPLFASVGNLDLRLGVLLTAFVLFFPPLTLLGMVSPYAIRLKASNLERIGTTAGNLYAASTVASVAAALVTGFILIPHIGVQRLFWCTGCLLIITAGVGFVARKKVGSGVLVMLAAGVAALLTPHAVSIGNPDVRIGLLAVQSSAYADVRVVDQDSVRYLLIDGGSHSAIDLSTQQCRMPYVNVIDLVKSYFAAPGHMLAVGLGGGSVVTSFAHDRWVVDAVEIDPVVPVMARAYFGLADTDAWIYEMDGRQYLATHDRNYDVIVMDAYGSSFIPFHLVTAEAFALARTRLLPDGILALNVESVGWYDPLITSVAATLRKSFRHVMALPIAEPPDQFGNVVLLASDRSLDLKSEPPVPIDRFSPEYDRAHAWDNRFEPDISNAQVLTDDLNPVDTWSGRINAAARTELHKTLDIRGLAW